MASEPQHSDENSSKNFFAVTRFFHKVHLLHLLHLKYFQYKKIKEVKLLDLVVIFFIVIKFKVLKVIISLKIVFLIKK